MSNLNPRIAAFSNLGSFLSQFSTNLVEKRENVPFNDPFFDVFSTQIKRQHEFNGWFTQDNILFACESWSKLLTVEQLTKWTSSYSFTTSNKRVAVIMAGNLPLVGFHDFLSVLIAGHNIIIKQSSNDKHLLPILAKYLVANEPSLKDAITFTDGELNDFDAVIATGSDNTARYFDYYFKKYPAIIRRNRNSVAVLTGKETTEQLELLADDIFRYFGLGCRSVSKVFVPKDYNFDLLFNALYKYKDLISNAKYANNYDYNKAVYLMSLFNILDNGFCMLKEDTSFSSPIASIFYEYYTNLDELKSYLNSHANKIQCIVSDQIFEKEIPFGQTQMPKLNDYADGVNTLEFLSTI